MPDEPIRRPQARCELPGCEVIIDAATGGAKRQRYCSAAHRISARQLRRAKRIATQADRTAEAMQSDHPADAAEAPEWAEADRSAGWAAEAAEWPRAARPPIEDMRGVQATRSRRPVNGFGAASVAVPSRRPVNGTRVVGQQGNKDANRRSALRRRAIAVLGVTSVLVAGQHVVGMERNTAPDPPAGLTTAAPAEPDVRVDRAAVERGLELVDAQLDMITQAMGQWRLLHGPSTPPEVRELMERQRVVEQVKATLVSKLTAMGTLERAAADRAAAEQALAAIDHALSTTPTSGSPQEANTLRQLTDQKTMWTQRRDQVVAANAAAQRAVAEPMPDVSDHTSPLAQQVVAITGRPAPAPADRKRGSPVALAPREHAAEEKPAVYTSAPPRPTPLDRDQPPRPDGSAGGDGQLHSAAGNTRTAPAPSGDRSAAPSRADLAAADEALNTAAGWAPAAGDVMPAYVDHAANRPGPGGGHPMESRSSGPHTGEQALPGWVQQARTHMDEDLA